MAVPRTGRAGSRHGPRCVRRLRGGSRASSRQPTRRSATRSHSSASRDRKTGCRTPSSRSPRSSRRASPAWRPRESSVASTTSSRRSSPGTASVSTPRSSPPAPSMFEDGLRLVQERGRLMAQAAQRTARCNGGPPRPRRGGRVRDLCRDRRRGLQHERARTGRHRRLVPTRSMQRWRSPSNAERNAASSCG